MRPSTRRSDDADVIRARLRALLAQGHGPGGWVPDESDQRGPEDHEDEDDAEDDGNGDGEPDHWEMSLVDDPAVPVVGRHRTPGRTARVAPDRPSAWALWAAALVAVLLVLGWTWLQRPDVEPAPSAAPEPSTAAAAHGSDSRGRNTGSTGSAVPTGGAPDRAPAPATQSGTVVVSVVGKVARPGLVTLAPGARVADALAAAGGVLADADAATVNAAAVLSDGQQIAVGVPGAAVPGAAGTPGGTGAATGPVDLNTATAADLDALPGVGPVLAQRIVDHRAEHGPFTSVEQLDDVSGIGPALFAQLAPRVRV